jgi:hypothetical protein
MADASRKEQNRERKLDGRGLSENSPLPNIVRIESLNAKARERYLSGLNNIRDIARTGDGDAKEVFYGFTSADAKTKGFQISSDWGKSGNGMGVLGAVKGLVSQSKKLPSALGKIGQVADGLLDVGIGLADAGTALTGTDYKNVGGASIKDYKGTDLKGFTVSCGWYLPEQYKTCVKSLRQLVKMAYPKTADVTDITNGVIKGLERSYNAFTSSGGNAENGDNGRLISDDSDLKKKIDDAGNALTSLFGFDLTFDPIPVRVAMGDYVDIEPLVINSITIDYSSDMYIQPNGKFMPIFCTVNIGFDFWMNPSPDMQFMKVLGQEMLGSNDFDLKGVE